MSMMVTNYQRRTNQQEEAAGFEIKEIIIYFTQCEASCTRSYASIGGICLFKHHLPWPWTNIKLGKACEIKYFSNLYQSYVDIVKMSMNILAEYDLISKEETRDKSVGEFLAKNDIMSSISQIIIHDGMKRNCH